jgi:glycosyltransferase involved in cell wall biosynthesis
LERVARELALGEKVEFLGYVSEMEKVRLLQVAWLVAYPSPKEGWGILSLEAAACGTPVVASDSPGLRDSVAPDRSGLLVPHGDVGSRAAALRRILTDSAARSGLSVGAIEHAAGFGWARAAVETERHLRGVLVSGAVAGPDAS